MGMTYRDLFYKATRLIDKGEITLGEYEEMTKPLDEEIMTKADYENRLKADMVAILTELQLEIEECVDGTEGSPEFEHGVSNARVQVVEMIQERINSIKEDKNEIQC